MSLFDLIWEATVNDDLDAAWAIIEQFEPFIIKVCTIEVTGEINEDLRSDIYTTLFKRIHNFKIFE